MPHQTDLQPPFPWHALWPPPFTYCVPQNSWQSPLPARPEQGLLEQGRSQGRGTLHPAPPQVPPTGEREVMGAGGL